MTSRREAFRLLGLTPDASQTEVRAAFRRKAIQHHPDTAASEADGSTVRKLIDAYQLLTGTPVVREGRLSAAQQTRLDPGLAQWRADPAQKPCRECRTTGFRIRMLACPACRGSSFLTILDIRRVNVFRCPHCRGWGRLPAIELCPVCEGTGVGAT
jgi:DnaJ-class molecular chaperone